MAGLAKFKTRQCLDSIHHLMSQVIRRWDQIVRFPLDEVPDSKPSGHRLEANLRGMISYGLSEYGVYVLKHLRVAFHIPGIGPPKRTVVGVRLIVASVAHAVFP